MKRIVLLISFIAALALCASAQTYIDFHEMPMAKAPSPMPDLYPTGAGLYWDNFFYVTPGAWDKAGPGFWVSPNVHDVAFVGGPMCAMTVPCFATLKINAAPVGPTAQTFTPVSMTLSAGWLANRVIITAFNNGKLVGEFTLKLGTTPHPYSFPASWKNVTQLVFKPEIIPNHAIHAEAGSMVVYDFIMIKK